MRYDYYLLSRYQHPAYFDWNLPLFHRHSAIISPIVNLKVGTERAAETAQCTYSSCYYPIRPQIHNWSQICRKRKVGTAVRFQPGQKPTVLCAVRIMTRQDKSRSGVCPELERNRNELPLNTRTAGGLPGHVANTSWKGKPELRDPSQWQAWSHWVWGFIHWTAGMPRLQRTWNSFGTARMTYAGGAEVERYRLRCISSGTAADWNTRR